MRHTVDEDDAKVPAGIESALRRRRHNRERVETDSNRRISSVERSKAILAASPTEIFFSLFLSCGRADVVSFIRISSNYRIGRS